MAGPPPPNVKGLFWGDGDHAVYEAIAWGTASDSVLYKYVNPVVTADRRLYVALVVDGNLNDNAFDSEYGPYMISAGWPSAPNVRPAFHLMNSEFAEFTVDICGDEKTWQQGYARQFEGIVDGVGTGKEIPISKSNNISATWVSGPTIATGSGVAPDDIESSSSIVWNLNHYAAAAVKTFDMNVKCGTTLPCTVYDWKSPFVDGDSDTVTNTGGFPEVISRTATPPTPLKHSSTYEWEWAMVYEWSVPLGTCEDYSISTGTTHHSPSKTGISDDPTPVTLIALAASTSAALLPIAGLVVGVSGVIVAPRRRRRRDQ